MIAQILLYLVQTLFSLYLVAVLLRFLLQLVRADFYNPISQFLVKVTNPVLRPLRRVIPGLGGLDLAALLLALLVQFVGMGVLLMISGYGLPGAFSLLLWSLIGVSMTLLDMYFLLLIASIAISWIAPTSHHPAAVLVQQVIEPLLAPARRVIPAVGGIDLSPIVAFLGIKILDIIVQNAAIAAGMPRGLVLGL